MIHKTPLPNNIEQRLGSLGQALDRCPRILFAYLFGGAAASQLRPLSDVDAAVYLDESADSVEGTLEAVGVVTAHPGTDEVDREAAPQGGRVRNEDDYCSGPTSAVVGDGPQASSTGDRQRQGLLGIPDRRGALA